MDTWTDDQVIRMQVGGNDRARKFFTNQPEYRKNMSIKELYSSKFANTYANKLTRAYQRHIESMAKSNETSPTSEISEFSASVVDEINSDINGSKNSSKNTSPTSDNSNWENIYLFNSDPSGMLDPNKKEFDNITLLRVYRPSKEKNEEFFARKGRENEQRSEDLPPSKGGKYTGFGSVPLKTEKDTQNEKIAQLQKHLSTGWNFLASTVSSINENVIKPASTKVRDPQFSKNIENYAENIKRSITEKAFVAKDQINNAKDQISNAVQSFQKNTNGTNNNKNTDDIILSSMETDSNNSNNENNNNENSSNENSISGKEPFIVIDYDIIENSDDDIFNYPTNDNKYLPNQVTNNSNDFFDRRNSTNSFTSINESLSRAYSISSSSLKNLKLSMSNRSSRSSVNLSAINSPRQ